MVVVKYNIIAEFNFFTSLGKKRKKEIPVDVVPLKIVATERWWL